jgi:hypothetical protein
MTTFYGHFNIFGVTQFIDFRITPGGRDLNTVLQEVKSKGGIASISHAEAPGGEACMGCRWEPPAGEDMDLFSAVEVINGGQTMFSSAGFWDSEVRHGHRLAAIGGSDSHNATNPPRPPGSIGWPTTVVEADELSVPAILNGIRAGRTFVDLTASHDRSIDFDAESGTAHASMGGTLRVASAAPIRVRVHTAACAGSTVHLLLDGQEVPGVQPMTVEGADFNGTATINSGAGRHWLRVEIRDGSGTLQLLSSPLYINFP